MDLTTATPVEIDTVLADLYGKQWVARTKRDQQIDFAEEIEEGIRLFETGEPRYYRYSGYSQKQADECRAKAEVFQAEIDDLIAQANPLNNEFARRGGWTRFYSVRDGHIHSSMECSTCNKMGKPTEFGWIPEWSGRSEAEALEALVSQSHKTVLCTVCYPTAPVAWTVPREDDSMCKGSGTWDYDRSTARLGFYTGNAATCEHCGQRITVTQTGKMRKHNKAA